MRRIEDRDEILSFLEENHVGVLTTVTEDGNPQGSVVHFINDEFDIYFLTRNSTRKYKNIEANPNVNFLIYHSEHSKVLHNEGVCGPVTDMKILKKLVERVSDRHTSKHDFKFPPLTQIKEAGDYALMKITPNSSYFLVYDHSRVK